MDGGRQYPAGHSLGGTQRGVEAPTLAKELIALQPDLILSHGTPNTATLLQETRAIPIVFAAVSDPVGSGFIASFSLPGGNVTGFANMEPTMASKWLELLKEVAPRVERVAILSTRQRRPMPNIG